MLQPSEVETLIEEALNELGIEDGGRRRYYKGFLFTKYYLLLYKTPDEIVKEVFKNEIRTHRFLDLRFYTVY